MTTRPFALAPILSTYHDRLLVPFDDYRDLLDHLNGGHHVWLMDMAAFRRTAAKALPALLPAIARTDPPPFRLDTGAGTKYVKAMAKVIGTDTVDIGQLPRKLWVTS